MESTDLQVRSFEWEDWPSLWELRRAQLAEHGIVVEETIIGPPDPSSPYEQDYHRMDSVYLGGGGGFWLAWWNGQAVGHVGAQDLGGVAELRRMFVRPDYRRRGIGGALVRTPVAHCRSQGLRAIELWTAEDGAGQFVYRSTGFRRVAEPGPEYQGIERRDEMRMRLDLGEG